MKSAQSWPHRVLLRAATRSLDDELLRDHSEEDWTELAKVATAHGVEGWVARELRGRPSVPPDFQLRFQAAAARVAGNHHARLADATNALNVLAEVGIEAMVLKGAPLVERYYRDPSLRTYGDVDLYVRPSNLRRALTALEASGMHLTDRNWPLLIEDLRGQIHLNTHRGGTLELHWHIVNGLRQRRTLRMDPDELWEAAEDGELAGVACKRLSPGDEIAHLCLHAAMHGCNRFIWLLDLATIAGATDVDWDVAAIRLQRWRFGAGGYLVMALANAFAGANIPLSELRSLRPGRPSLRTYRRLVQRWDLAEPVRDSRLRELFFATAGDGPGTRFGLAVDVVVPSAGHEHGHRAPTWLETLRRATIGTAARVRGKFGEHETLSMAEYVPVGDQSAGREAFLRSVERRVTPQRAGAPHVVILSPSPSLGMSHYTHAVAEAMAPSAKVTVLDGAEMGRLRMWARLRALLHDGDVLVLDTSPHWTAPLMAWTPGVRGGHIFHDPILSAATARSRPLHERYYRLLTQRLGLVVLHSHAFRRNVAELDLRARRVVVVPHGFVPVHMGSDAPYDPGGPFVLLGRLLPYKGAEVLLSALRILEGRGVRVRVVLGGEGVTPEMAHPELPGLEVLPGALADQAFRDLIASCSAVLLPYVLSTQSGVLATAFRAGRPVIASAVGSFPWYVRDGENGLLVPPGDPVPLAAAIERTATDRALANRMAEGARRSWEEDLAPERAAQRIVDALVAVSGR